ncbi:MAG: hypothetical protein HPY87_10120 [Fervidobacterium sp.]|uniref:hypothetical protein n=1 Tax=Fervidobacterium sp. TaxID=1871331 RepID=UPI0025C39AAA|nr:hypothetical protein [Fervidobacterium sp.]NPU90214.1 hypothetical protein [Fervidobacterium sp.]
MIVDNKKICQTLATASAFTMSSRENPLHDLLSCVRIVKRGKSNNINIFATNLATTYISNGVNTHDNSDDNIDIVIPPNKLRDAIMSADMSLVQISDDNNFLTIDIGNGGKTKIKKVATSADIVLPEYSIDNIDVIAECDYSALYSSLYDITACAGKSIFFNVSDNAIALSANNNVSLAESVVNATTYTNCQFAIDKYFAPYITKAQSTARLRLNDRVCVIETDSFAVAVQRTNENLIDYSNFLESMQKMLVANIDNTENLSKALTACGLFSRVAVITFRDNSIYIESGNFSFEEESIGKYRNTIECETTSADEHRILISLDTVIGHIVKNSKKIKMYYHQDINFAIIDTDYSRFIIALMKEV